MIFPRFTFFDYDAHQTNLGENVNEDVVRQMLDSFDNETENGRGVFNQLWCSVSEYL